MPGGFPCSDGSQETSAMVLSPQEAETVLKVLERDRALRERDLMRLGDLKLRLNEKESHSIQLAKPDPLDQQHCIHCCLPFEPLRNSPETCLDCHNKVCKCCALYSHQEQGWHCLACAETWHIKAFSMDWFYDSVRNRFGQNSPNEFLQEQLRLQTGHQFSSYSGRHCDMMEKSTNHSSADWNKKVKKKQCSSNQEVEEHETFTAAPQNLFLHHSEDAVQEEFDHPHAGQMPPAEYDMEKRQDLKMLPGPLATWKCGSRRCGVSRQSRDTVARLRSSFVQDECESESRSDLENKSLTWPMRYCNGMDEACNTDSGSTSSKSHCTTSQECKPQQSSTWNIGENSRRKGPMTDDQLEAELRTVIKWMGERESIAAEIPTTQASPGSFFLAEDSDSSHDEDLLMIQAELQKRFSATSLSSITGKALRLIHSAEMAVANAGPVSRREGSPAGNSGTAENKTSEEARSTMSATEGNAGARDHSVPPADEAWATDGWLAVLEENVYMGAGRVFALEEELTELELRARSVQGHTPDMELSSLEDSVASAAAQLQLSEAQISEIERHLHSMKLPGFDATLGGSSQFCNVPKDPMRTALRRRKLPAPPLRDSQVEATPSML
uniref:rab effector MyRIP-like isoform X1 n=1 Tax=Myxine glutinosa TaxID=7769 RepID=UPI00358F953F